ncbi:MAG: hypothetical protein P8J20_12120 [Novosphingobium sp.]|nr:hypothetical protein [Novosphingobium sp.]
MQKLFGGVLIGCGILIAGVSGLCVLIIVGTFLTEFSDDGGMSELLSMLPMVFVYAGIPIGIGAGLFFLGRHLIRQANAESQSPQDQTDTFK